MLDVTILTRSSTGAAGGTTLLITAGPASAFFATCPGRVPTPAHGALRTRISQRSTVSSGNAGDGAWRSRGDTLRLGQCSGMTPEDVRLDLAGADEFSVVCQSLPRTDPQSV